MRDGGSPSYRSAFCPDVSDKVRGQWFWRRLIIYLCDNCPSLPREERDCYSVRWYVDIQGAVGGYKQIPETVTTRNQNSDASSQYTWLTLGSRHDVLDRVKNGKGSRFLHTGKYIGWRYCLDERRHGPTDMIFDAPLPMGDPELLPRAASLSSVTLLP